MGQLRYASSAPPFMMLSMSTVNPFKKTTEKPTQVTISLAPEQRKIVEQLRDHLGVKTNTAVLMEGLAVLYDANRRQLAKEHADTASSAE
jgi:hypothetical protein